MQVLVNYADSRLYVRPADLTNPPDPAAGLPFVFDLGDEVGAQPLDSTTRTQVIAAMASLRADTDPIVARAAQYIYAGLLQP